MRVRVSRIQGYRGIQISLVNIFLLDGYVNEQFNTNNVIHSTPPAFLFCKADPLRELWQVLGLSHRRISVSPRLQARDLRTNYSAKGRDTETVQEEQYLFWPGIQHSVFHHNVKTHIRPHEIFTRYGYPQISQALSWQQI